MSEGKALSMHMRWYAGLTATHWRALTGSFLGWIFDGYETYALIFVLVPALITLLPKNQLNAIPVFFGAAVGVTLLGWGIGGIIGSVATDYVGRIRMMMISMLGYSALTGLTALSQSFLQLAAFRFLTGLFIGSEWSTGISLITETWPDRARPKGAGFLQSGFGWGAFLAAIAWFIIAPLGSQAWRYMFLVGTVPAVFTLYVRSKLKESEKWRTAVREHRWAATPDEAELQEKFKQVRVRPFTLAEVFRERHAREYIISTFLMSLAIIIGWWAISTLVPRFGMGLAQAAGYKDLPQWGSIIGLVYTAGGIAGYMSAGFVADFIGRKPFLLLTFLGCLLINFITFIPHFTLTGFLIISAINGFFTLGFAFVWMAIYLPELFTSSVRSTAIGFVFNASRLLAWIFPIIAGILIVRLGGISMTALLLGLIYILGIVVMWFVPETKGRPIT